MWQSLPEFGTVVLYAILAAAAYTFAVSLAAGAGRPRLLSAARLGAYGTIALVGVAVLTLSFAFVSNDFRLSYVSRYSDRGMTTAYLFVALWGGQDGSWLWWLFLTSVFSGACVRWMGRRYLELQPYVIATLMSILAFDAILLIFAVAPFSVNLGGAPLDGEGLNYQLRTFYMIIHPPSLYIGFTSCAVPFAFCVAALVTGRLDSEWINATRKWMVFSWLFLTIGNILGMMWAYEELGWGGDWAWDPVENAACLPWWTASAYVHSTMIQERRGMLKVWNVALICATFWLTIFGTFLTRSGLISSVHSFAKSNIGEYFMYYMGFVAATCVGLIVWRLPRLRSEASFDNVLSRETAFVLNNWALLGCGSFIAVATTWPLFSEFFLNYKSSVGPTFYNFWLPIPLVLLFALMCIAPLMGWRKTSPELLKKSFIWPVAAMIAGVGLHFALAKVLRMPAFVQAPNVYPLPDPSAAATMDGSTLFASKMVHYFGAGIAWVNGKLPLVVSALASFKLAVVIQEFARGVKARQKTQKGENVVLSFFNLVAKSRRRYGGYIVHIGVVLVYIHFAGRAWSTDIEASIPLGDSLVIDEAYTVKYVDTRRDNDPEKMVIISDLVVYERGKDKGHLYPSRFIYKNQRGDNSTEVARHITLRDDLYVTMAHVDPKTKIATFHFHVNPFAVFLVIGAGIMLFGAFISLWPDLQQEQEVNAFTYVRAAVGLTASAMFCAMLVFFPRVFPVHAGVDPPSSAERALQLEFSEMKLTTLVSAGSRWFAKRRPARKEPVRRWIRAALFACAVLAIVPTLLPGEAISQAHVDKGGTVGIQNATERELFFSLICACGCPRETLGTCTCGYGNERRDELRAMLDQGMSIQVIQEAYGKRFGSQFLSLPPNKGASRLIWALPLIAFVAGAFLVITLLRRWTRRGRANAAAADAASAKETADTGGVRERDAYDDKLDDQLKELDRE